MYYDEDGDEIDVYDENGDQIEEKEDGGSSNGSFVWGIIIVLVIIALIWGIGKNGKYEGQTAEEWFNDYDNAEAEYQDLYDCVEPFATAGKYISADDLYYECF